TAGTGLTEKVAREIADDVESEIRKIKLDFVSSPLIREITNIKLLEHGLEDARARYTRLGMPVYDVTQLINFGSKENANLQHNPETTHKLMADAISREYALINVLPLDLADAHMTAELHIHDLDYYASRPFCLPAKETVILANPEGEVLTTEIGKFVDKIMEKKKNIKNIGGNEVMFSPGYKVFSFDQKSYQIQPKEITAVSRRENGGEKIISLKTKWTKRTIKATENHEIFVWENGIRTKKLKNMKRGDRVIIPLKLPDINKIEKINLIDEFLNRVPESDLKTVYVRNFSGYKKFLRNICGKNLQEIFDQIGIKYYGNSIPILEFKRLYKEFGLPHEVAANLTLGVGGSENELNTILKFSPELMRLMGYFVGDGNYNINPKPPKQSYNLAVTCSNPEIQEDLQHCIEKYSRYATWYKNDGKERGDQVYFGGKLLYLIFRYVFGIVPKANQKNAPRYLLNSSIENTSNFLSGYYSSDGNLNVAEKYSLFRVECNTASEDLCSDLCYLFGRFGILPSTGIKKTNGYADGHRIGIGGIEQVKKFREHIKFIDSRRNQKLQEHSVKTQGSGSPLTKNGIGDVVFEEVDSIEIEEYSGHLYDLVVNGTHNFLAGNNGPMVIHNCFSHDLRFFLKNGFKADGTGAHTSVAGPAKRAEVAFLHAAKILAASQTNCAGGQGYNWFNSILAPYVSGLDYKKIQQLAQMFIYEMSVDGEEKIPILDGDEFKIMKIKNFVDKIIGNNGVIRNNKNEIVKLNSNYKVLGFDERGVVKFLKITGVSRHKAPELYEIKTKFGKKIRVTGHHSLFTFDGKDIVPIEAEKLNAGDYVVGIKNINVFVDKEYIDLYDELCEVDNKFRVTNLSKLVEFLGKNSGELGDKWFVNQLLEGKRTISFNKLKEIVGRYDVPRDIIDEILVTSSTYSKKKYYLPLKLPISKELLRLLGYYLAEGYTNASDEGMGVGLGIDHNMLVKEDVKRCIRNVFGAEPYHAEEFNLRFGGKLGVFLFRDVLNLGEYSTEKKLPDWILVLPKKKLREILKSYITSDGWVSDSRLIAFTTSSKELRGQLRFMFLRFGIPMREDIVRKKGDKIMIKGVETEASADSHRLYISDYRSAEKYLKDIGFVNEKSTKLTKILEQREDMQTPEHMLLDIGGEMHSVESIACNPLGHDLCMEKITGIKEVKEEGYVYDLEVEPMQNFITMKALALHNSQMYVARGGQMVFSSIDLDFKIPEHLRDIPAVQPGGKVNENVTYGDFDDEANKLFNAITDVYLGGDYWGKPFNFPKYEVKIYPKELDKQKDELLRVSELAAKFGTPYYIIQQPYMPEFSCYQCCAYLMPLDDATTDEDLHNGTVRGGALQVITLNLPKIAYDANGDDDRLFELLRERMGKAKKALLLKMDTISRNMGNNLLPFLSQEVDDKGTRYLEPDKQSYVIGLVGMNEMVKFHTGEELHESDDAWKFGLKVMKEMKDIIAGFRAETGLNFTLARTPAESTGYRLASIDFDNYGDIVIANGDPSDNTLYYTNSFHVRPNANIPLFKRLSIEGSFHPLTDGGAMSHVWLGESYPSSEALYELTKKIATKTAIQYFAYTRDLTVCNRCNKVVGFLVGACPNCGATDITWEKQAMDDKSILMKDKGEKGQEVYL
ncbi:MAG: hypothetical protein A7315_00650, partial [Candidatus Altiarchaeales archaeon WOR_SM1_79]